MARDLKNPCLNFLNKNKMSYKYITAEEAASFIQNGQQIAMSGFTPAGALKVIPKALAAKAEAEHAAGRPFKVSLISGASTGDSCDGVLARAKAIDFRTPYQSNADLRAGANATPNEINFVDMHLSMAPQFMNYGFMGKIDWAIVEAVDVSDNGEILLSTSVGISPTGLKLADKILIELNEYHSKALRGFHDIYETANPPMRREIPIYSAGDRCGSEVVKVDPSKIVGIVRTNLADEVKPFKPTDPITQKIGENVADFLASEMKAGRIPPEFLPIQSGVGNIANAVLGALGENPDIPQFSMYSEVLQDSVIDLIVHGHIKTASATSLTVTPEKIQEIYANPDFFRGKIILRPQEISNSPEVARRIGIISINTAIEVDLEGNVNSSHIMGKNLMNGIGGSGDFTRNAYISIYTTPSVAKNGAISAIVPNVSHCDHTEHSVNIIATEFGVADLRCKTPMQRAEILIEKCAHPDYKELLRDYLKAVSCGHTPQTLAKAFAFHEAFVNEKDMRLAKF